METVAALEIREGLTSDHRLLAEIDEVSRSKAERAIFLRNALERGECLVAQMQGAVLGFVVLNYGFFGFGFIPLIVVGAKHRGFGVGLRLMLAAEAHCLSRKLFTSTNASNAAAHGLFARACFSRSGVVENLDEGDPEIVYFKPCIRHDR